MVNYEFMFVYIENYNKYKYILLIVLFGCFYLFMNVGFIYISNIWNYLYNKMNYIYVFVCIIYYFLYEFLYILVLFIDW